MNFEQDERLLALLERIALALEIRFPHTVIMAPAKTTEAPCLHLNSTGTTGGRYCHDCNQYIPTTIVFRPTVMP